MLSRRTFFKTAGLGAAVAASASFPTELLSWAEPPRAPQPGGPILLNSNENAYGPFPSVLAMTNPFQGVNRYPDRREDILVEALAKRHGVDPSRVLTGCGSGEILHIAAFAFTGPGRKLVIASPTFEAIGTHAEVMQAEVVRVPLASNFAHDLGAMLKAAGTDASLVYICNPNNPTASLTPRADIEDFLHKLPGNTKVLIDEAYHDFVPAGPDYVSFLDRPVDDDRVIVCRTFSKIYGLAGMRLGYSIASKSTIAQMRRQHLDNSANIFVTRCALISMEDTAFHQHAVKRNAADRDEFMRQAALRKLKPIPSSANFVMMETGRPVRSLIDYFAANNVAIGRPFPPLEKFARISLGLPEEMTAFWKVWDTLPKVN
jgi:histidinol-phosphate aminotransferase